MFFSLAGIEVGDHLYWSIGGIVFHGEVLIILWLVIGVILLICCWGYCSQLIPGAPQSFVEYIFFYVSFITRGQLGENQYRPWVPFVGTLFIFIFVSNWVGALLPWKLLHLPAGGFTAPTVDINTTVALALLTSLSYFYAGLKKKRCGIFYTLCFTNSYFFANKYFRRIFETTFVKFSVIW
jgi:F-type H+-transporting ATPase subunit a